MANLLQEAHKEELKDVQQHRMGVKRCHPSSQWYGPPSVRNVDMTIGADAVSSMNLIEQIMDEQLNLFKENYELYYDILDKLNKHCADVAGDEAKV